MYLWGVGHPFANDAGRRRSQNRSHCRNDDLFGRYVQNIKTNHIGMHVCT